ncbi:GNAT family N-acetyltransferase [Streptomyces sp. NA02950]|uniref:GNAT family N-acetyltransferase n=1 Tax=Streptomyces sp. NA02950 TaxID=2742137 RepID=UPI001591CE7C|nr:GNAT family N-acetyltransferase [Streptomyces sp. NA02950]QKV96748.1 GNAT family N-acetyltransferase [Streptomyces sp. NA02950]
MDRDAVLALYNRRMRRGALPDGPGARIERAGAVVRQTGGRADWNGVLWSDLDPSTADAVIEAQIRHFTALGHEFEWKLYAHDRPDDLATRLRAAGFTAGPEETLMVARTGDLGAGGGPPEGVQLCPVIDAAGVEAVSDVHARVFGPDGGRLERRLLARLAEAPDTAVAVLAVAGDRPVSAARLELPPGAPFAGLWGGGTVPDWRGRGVYRSLVAFRARVAADRGYPWLQVDASDLSRPVLRRLGFVPLTTTTPFVHPNWPPLSVGCSTVEP